MGHNNSKYQNSLEIEQLKVGWLELTFKIFSFSLYFLIPPSNFKLLYLRTILTYRDVSPHFVKLKNRILHSEVTKIIASNQETGKNKIRKF